MTAALPSLYATHAHTSTYLHLSPLASFTTAVLSETIQSKSHIAWDEKVEQDGAARASFFSFPPALCTVYLFFPSLTLSHTLPHCLLASALLNTTEAENMKMKGRERWRREGGSLVT